MPVQLSPDLTDAALGLAPMPFPILVTDRFDEFWTFKDSGFMAATLPGLALQVHALDVYPALLRVMRRAFPEAVSEFPDSAAILMSDGSLHAHVLHLRAIFRQFPDRATQVSSATDEVAKSLVVSQQRRLRAAVSFYAGNIQRYLNVYGPPEAIPTLSITEVLARRPTRDSPDPLGLRDKVVFVGFADGEDWEPLEKFATAFNAGGRRLSGVEIAATAFANLLDGISLQSMPLLMRAALAFGIGFGAALLLYVETGTRGTLVCLAGLAIYLGVTLLLFTRLQLWAPVIIPVLIAIPAAVAYLGLVRLELLEGGPNRRVLVSSVLQFDERQRQAVDEQHDVRTPRVLVLADGELVGGEPVVVVGIGEVDHPRLRAADGAILRPVLYRHAVHEQAMHGTVARLQRRPFGRVSFRKASSRASAGSAGLRRASASRSRWASTTWA